METKIAVIGLGYVGLPLALALSRSYPVYGLDANKDKIAMLNSGKCCLSELKVQELFSKSFGSKSIKFFDDISESKHCPVKIICVQTPISDNGKAELRFLLAAIDRVSQEINKHDLLIIESSIPPGTMYEISRRVHEKNGLIAGKDYYLAHCPERIFPGSSLEELENNERIIGGVNAESAEHARKIYSSFVKNRIHLSTNLKAVELSKLVENTYRDVNIAFANELAKICDELECDVSEVIRLANTHPRVNVHNPGVGVGGPCIPKDPLILVNSVPDLDLRLIMTARRINENAPNEMLKKIANKINLKNKNFLILGLAYKANVDDMRDSPAIQLKKMLTENGAQVYVFDPLISGYPDSLNTPYDMSNLDGVILVTNHDLFKDIDFKRLRNCCRTPLFFDGRNMYSPETVSNEGFVYTGIGRG